MSNKTLLDSLKSIEKKEKESKRKNVNIDASFGVLTDEEILLVLAHRAKKLRVSENIKQSTFSKNAQLSSPSTYSNFEQTGKVSLLNFIKIIRAFGRLNELQSVLKSSLSQKINLFEKKGAERKRAYSEKH